MLLRWGEPICHAFNSGANTMISNRNCAELKNGLSSIFSAKVFVLIAIKMPILAPLASGAA